MKLTNIFRNKLLSDVNLRATLAAELNFSPVWMDRLIVVNKSNGPLTTAKALQVYKQETGLTDVEILEEEIEEKEAAK